MRPSILVLALILGGCAATPFATTGPDAGATARLAIGDRVHYAFVPGRDGIISVDGRTVPEGPVRETRLVPGRRTIGYACPGWVTVDGPATMSRTFVAGGRYMLTCEDPPAIKQVPQVPDAQGHDVQAMVGPSFESLFYLTDQACPAARIRYATPAALLDAEDTYIATLPAADKTRVASAAPRDASGGYSACANRDGAGCSVAAGLRAIEQAGLTRGFVASACRQFGKPG